MILEVLLQAAVLCGILYAVARYEADYSFQKVAMVAAGIALGNMVIEALLHGYVRPDLRWLLIFPCVAFTSFMIMTFCWINVWKSLLVVVLFVAFQLLMQLGLAMLTNHYAPSADERNAAIQKKKDESVETQKQIVEMMAGQTPSASVPVPPKATAKSVPKTTRRAATVKEKAAAPEKSLADKAGWVAAEKRLKVAGISSAGGQKVALVNNNAVTENGMVRVTHNNKVYRWRAVSITKDGVEWKRVDVSAVKAAVRKRLR